MREDREIGVFSMEAMERFAREPIKNLDGTAGDDEA
jgi:hypothetical protein